MVNRALWFYLVVVIIVPIPSIAYEQPTHEDMSQHALEASAVATSDVLTNLGLSFAIGDERQTFPNSDGKSRRIVELIRDGANFEDNNLRPLFHFFDPLNDEGLIFYTSPTWALEDNGNIHLLQNYSLRDARDYLYKALTLLDSSERKRYFGRTFESLGRVIHHIQDMAQPQHVRLDSHLNLNWTDEELPFENRSRYEKYTNEHRNDGVFIQYLSPGTYPQVTFTKARKFWHTEGKNPSTGMGLAEFTSTNFVSAGTNLNSGRYPSPNISSATIKDEDANALFQSVGIPVPAQCLPPSQPCVMTFYSTPVVDNYHPEASSINPRTATASIFDQDLMAQGLSPVFSLNRFNFNAAHEFLIPRAVAYSAGIINHFFRGKLAVSAPDEGVYAILDHAVTKAKDAEGFTLVKLKVKNVTPDIVTPNGTFPQDMQNGKLVAVARFRRNICYLPDLGGELKAPGYTWNGCSVDGYRSRDEEVVVSREIAGVSLPAAPDAKPVPYGFTFDKPIPVNATDLYVQVVYRGALGDESDAVVVATKDMREPTFVTFFNGTDFAYLKNLTTGTSDWYNALDQRKAMQDILNKYVTAGLAGGQNLYAPQPGVLRNMQLRFGASPKVAAVVPELPPAASMRVAVLTDMLQQRMNYIAGWTGQIKDDSGTIRDGDKYDIGGYYDFPSKVNQGNTASIAEKLRKSYYWKMYYLVDWYPLDNKPSDKSIDQLPAVDDNSLKPTTVCMVDDKATPPAGCP